MGRRVRDLSLCVLVVALATACGSKTTTTAPSAVPAGLTTADVAQLGAAISAAISGPIAQALAAGIAPRVGAAAPATGEFPLSPHSTAIKPAALTPLAGTVGCPDAGSITLSGSVDVEVSSGGTGSTNLSSQIGFLSCSSQAIPLRGNPTLGMDVQFNFVSAQLVNPGAMHLTNGIAFTLKGTDGTAAFGCSIAIDVRTFVFTYSGNVTLEYPTGKNTTVVPCQAFLAAQYAAAPAALR